MKKEDVTAAVDQDLAHIAKGPSGGPQNMFRMAYNAQRRHDLSLQPIPAKSETLQGALADVRKHYPEFVPEYDRNYFAD